MDVADIVAKSIEGTVSLINRSNDSDSKLVDSSNEALLN